MRKKLVFTSSIILLLLTFGVIFEISHYPRIVRSAYLTNPVLLAKTIYYQNFPGPGKSAWEVVVNILHEEENNAAKVKDANLLYLDNYPRADKILRDRYLSLLSKLVVKTEENLFWEYKTEKRYTLVEYKTGKIIFDQIEGKQRLPYFREVTPNPIVNTSSKNYDQSSLDRLVFTSEDPGIQKFNEVGLMNPQDGEYLISFYKKQLKETFEAVKISGENFFSQAEHGLEKNQGLSSDRKYLLPIYLEQALFTDKPAWILIYAWENKDAFRPERQEGLFLKHRAVVVLSQYELKTLYTNRCK